MQQGAGIVTLDQVFDQADQTVAYTAAQARKWLRLIDGASRIITQFTRRSFVPYRQAKTYDARGGHIDTYTLQLNADLLEVEALTNGDGSTISSSQYVLRPSNLYPKYAIRLKDSGSVSWTYTDAWEDAITVDGWWGYHGDYTIAWAATGDSVQDDGGINATTQTITVSDMDALDANYRPRFQIGMWIKIDDECMRVVNADAETDQITVIRAQLGTTAAVHAKSASITSYNAQYDIAQACIGLTIWLERNDGTVGEQVWFVQGGQVVMNQAPAYIGDTMKAYRKAKVIAI